MDRSTRGTERSRDRTTRDGGRRTSREDAPPDTETRRARTKRPGGEKEEPKPRREHTGRGSDAEDPDVLLDVPVVKVEEIELEVENLRAKVSLQAEVLDLLKLNVGADVELGRVELTIKGVEAQALLKVRLDNVRDILARVLETIDANPQILEHVTKGVGNAVEDVGEGAGRAVEGVGRGAGNAVEDVGEGAGRAVEGVGRGAGNAVEDVGEGAGGAVEDVGDTVEEVGQDVGDVVEDDDEDDEDER